MMVEMGSALMESGKTGGGRVRRNSDATSGIGSIRSWRLEFPGGLGHWKLRIPRTREARRKGYKITRKSTTNICMLIVGF